MRLVLVGKPGHIVGQLQSMLGMYGSVLVTDVIKDMKEWQK